MSQAKRQQIKDKVATGEARHRARSEATLLDRAGETAVEAKDRFTAFAREHPLTTIAGGLAVGILISGLFPRSPTRKLGRRAAGFAAVGAEAAMAYMHQAMAAANEAGRVGADRLDEFGESIGGTARRLRRDAAYLVSEASHGAQSVRHDASKIINRRLRGS